MACFRAATLSSYRLLRKPGYQIRVLRTVHDMEHEVESAELTEKLYLGGFRLRNACRYRAASDFLPVCTLVYCSVDARQTVYISISLLSR